MAAVAFYTHGQFRDASLGGTCSVAGDEPALRGIGKHLRKPGERYLLPVEALNVEIPDVDLAGGRTGRCTAPPCPLLYHPGREEMLMDTTLDGRPGARKPD